MKLVRGFGRFWYDFIVGDDWKIAACVVVALGIAAALVAAHALGDTGLVLVAAAGIVAGFVTSLVVDVRSR
jgi:hypothetical protein